MSTVKNADLWTVTFLDAADQPATDDLFSGPVSWWIKEGSRWYDIDGNELVPEYLAGKRVDLDSVVATTQEVGEKVSTGAFQIMVSPRIPVPYSVKAAAVVGDVEQATPFTQVEVTP
jgi:hypothetical protein